MNGARMTDTEGALLPHHGADLSLRRSGTLLVRASSISARANWASCPVALGSTPTRASGGASSRRGPPASSDLRAPPIRGGANPRTTRARPFSTFCRAPTTPAPCYRLGRDALRSTWCPPPSAEANPRPQPADSRARHREHVVRLPGLLTKLDGAPGANRDFANALLSAQVELREPFRDDCGNGVLLFSESVCSGCGQVCDRPSGGVPNGSLSPCATRVGAFTASSSARRQRSL